MSGRAHGVVGWRTGSRVKVVETVVVVVAGFAIPIVVVRSVARARFSG